MSTRKGTGCYLALFLAFSVLCSVSLVAQDKLLTNITGYNSKTADAASVNCSAYASDGVTCVAGQYYHSDNTRPNTVWTTPASSTAFGNWIEGNGSSSGCLSCHHGSITTAGRGGGYLIGGHKNILRKIVPGQTLFDTTSNQVLNVADHNGNAFTLSQTAGTISGTLGTFPAYYLAGWTAGEDVFGNGSTLAYGSCARCHTTGYRPDGNAPEPTVVTGSYNTGGVTSTLAYTKMTDAQFSRIPVGATTGTSSWSLTGVQCERCHKVDMQYSTTVVNPNVGTVAAPVLTNGRVNHFTNIVPASVNANATTGVITGTDFYLSAAVTGTATTRPLPNPPTALTCAECHQAYATWSVKAGGNATVGQVHLTPLPGFESLAPKSDGVNYTTTKEATGQFTATWGCTANGVAVAGIKTNDYNGCVAAGGTVTYVPGGMSHGAATTILNSPHARVTGYVDVKTQGSADTTLTINGGTVNGIPVLGQFNTHFASKGTADQGAPAGNASATNGVSGSCAGCHDIHGAMPTYAGFTGTNPPVDATNISSTTVNTNGNPIMLTACTSCHASHGNAMNHPTGPGTPFAAVNGSAGGFGSQESCSTCHLSKKTGTKYHFLRINPDPNYNTFPSAQQYYTTAGSGQFAPLNTYVSAGETYLDGNGATQNYPAVGLDVDIACGQCHTGGNGVSNPYGITPYAGDGGVTPRPYSRAFLAAAAVSMHNTNAAAPTFNIALPSTGAPTTITISSSSVSEGSYASIFYTTDGSTPTATVNASEQYVVGGTTKVAAGPSVSIPVTATTTIYAFAAGPASYSFTPSQVVGGTYGVPVAPKPVISPTNANIIAPATVNVTITDGLSGGAIYYTTDGSTPTASSTMYTGTIVVSTPEVINAIAIVPSYANSPVSTGTFTMAAAAPAFSLTNGGQYPGSYKGSAIAVLTDAAPSICYTTNGTTPTVTGGACNGSTVAPSGQITLNTLGTNSLNAVAFGTGYSTSKVTSGTYVISAAPTAMTSPTPGTTLSGSSATFTWTVGTGVTNAGLWVGTTAGGSDLYYGSASAGPITTSTVSGLPMNGSTVYVRLWSQVNGAWQYSDYTYKAATPTAMTSPTPGTALSGSSATFTWTVGTGVTNAGLWVGTTAGGSDLYYGSASAGPITASTVSGLPVNGSTIYVRLWSQVNGAWQYTDYTYTAM